MGTRHTGALARMAQQYEVVHVIYCQSPKRGIKTTNPELKLGRWKNNWFIFPTSHLHNFWSLNHYNVIIPPAPVQACSLNRNILVQSRTIEPAKEILDLRFQTSSWDQSNDLRCSQSQVACDGWRFTRHSSLVHISKNLHKLVPIKMGKRSFFSGSCHNTLVLSNILRFAFP